DVDNAVPGNYQPTQDRYATGDGPHALRQKAGGTLANAAEDHAAANDRLDYPTDQACGVSSCLSAREVFFEKPCSTCGRTARRARQVGALRAARLARLLVHLVKAEPCARSAVPKSGMLPTGLAARHLRRIVAGEGAHAVATHALASPTATR